MVYDAGEADVAVIGGGHAGCEAALAAARLGKKTVMFAISLDSIAFMPCNPDIGGTSKGHLVREIDALGGEMGKNADKAAIQIKMLNTGKGPAVHSLRAQEDKHKYSLEMKKTLENAENLRIKQAEIVDIKPGDGIIRLTSRLGGVYRCGAVVICGGTYLNAKCFYGDVVTKSGPSGLGGADFLSESLKGLGISMMRFKTGTPARVDRRSIDFSKMREQKGDADPLAFSFENGAAPLKYGQVSCYLTCTTEETHNIIRENLHLAPMYCGLIEGTGTRYCPSIEDKVVRFADRSGHQVFIEPEGLDTNEMYIQGVSTSLPEDVQIRLYRSIPGLENCEILRPAYAIEYDCVDATQLAPSLMFKDIPGLFCAGQVNGSSGYEEAAAQGLMAGINAARYLSGKDMLVIGRDEGYIGVLIDDLVIKGTKEPYRMMTSRAEYRLLLRQDNADSRLTEKGYKCGLIPEERYKRFAEKSRLIEAEIKRAESAVIPPGDKVNSLLASNGSAPIATGTHLAELIRRPELNYYVLAPVDTARQTLPQDVCEQVNICVKYEGYVKRQKAQAEKFRKMENIKLPRDFDYPSLKGLRLEAIQKLSALRPESLGAAMRITGVSPADISVLTVYLKK